MVMRSPSRTAASGPPMAASGATWPTMSPRVAPLNRPSVTRATDSPSPRPTNAAVTPSISRVPGVAGPLVSGRLHHRAVRGQVAGQDVQTAARLERRRERAQNLLSRRLRGVLRVLGPRFAVHHPRIAVQQAALEEPA